MTIISRSCFFWQSIRWNWELFFKT